MPINAIKIDHVDHILSPKEIANQLGSSARQTSDFAKTPLKFFG